MPIPGRIPASPLPTTGFTAGSIGPVFDMGISTRDGLSISVKNRKGDTVQVAACAYMASTQQVQEEATELQHKQQLTQLASPNLIDREFDAWPQVTQGDWTGGQGQRVLGSNLSSLGIPVGDATRYYEGYGLLYPLDDFVPQQPLSFTRTFTSQSIGSEIAGGLLAVENGGGTSTWGYAFVRVDPANGHYHLMFQPAGTGAAFDLDLSPNTVIGGPTMGHGAIWIAQGVSNTLVGFTQNAGVLVANSISALPTGFNPNPRVGAAGNQIYAAVAMAQSTGGFTSSVIRLWNLTKSGGQWATAATVDLPLTMAYQVSDIAFLGDDLIVAIGVGGASSLLVDGGDSYIMAFNLPAQQWRTLTRFPYQGPAFLCAVAGGLFIITMQEAAGLGFGALEMYLLQGNSIQDIGPLVVRDGTQVFPIVGALDKPKAMGPYAVFAVEINATPRIVTLVYAFDVLRGRLFKIFRNAESAGTALNIGTSSLGLAGSGQVVAGGQGYGSMFSMVMPAGRIVNNTMTLIEMHYAVSSTSGGPGPGPMVVTPTDITSSMIDFTSASPKLYRQVVASFAALMADANAGIQINVWLDQDVGALNPTPDFIVATNGSASPGATSLALPINKVAKKVVYEVMTAGGVLVGSSWVNAPKLISVAVQAATGWTWHVFLDLARNAKVNSQNVSEYAYQDQSSQDSPPLPMDEVSAYNFLRQLWRTRGGQCIVTLPNGDMYDALLQTLKFQSPKPFGVSFDASSAPDRYETIVELLLREDI